MYKRFNLSVDENDDQFKHYILPCYEEGQKYLSSFPKDYTVDILNLKSDALDTDVIDGDQIRESWFPQLQFDVFLSHSHQDKDTAIALTGWLYESFKLKAFIDSSVWGYCDNLLKELDNAYCLKSNNTYDYAKRNRTTSHAHMMLTSALTKMMDQTECIIFLNTKNSIPNTHIVNGKEVNDTYSPWIYHELLMSNSLKIRKPTNRLMHSRGQFTYDKEISYDTGPYLRTMQSLSIEDLITWKSKNHFKESALDTLYQLTNNK